MESWLVTNWFEVGQTVILGGGFLGAVLSLREDRNERRIQNLFAVNEAHREIWSAVYEKPALNRVLEPKVDLAKHPVTDDEQLFVGFLILHLRASFKARQLGMEFNDDDLAADIREFFNLPIPRRVWENAKKFQDPDFVHFVTSHL